MGRCPVRSVFPQALEALEKKHHLLKYVTQATAGTQLLTLNSFMADKIMPLSEAVEGYEIFDSGRAQKVVFEASK